MMKAKLAFNSLLWGFILVLIFSIRGHAQAVKGDQTKDNKQWLEMIQNPDVNFYEVQDLFNKYWENRTDYKGNGWKVFKRWEYINESRVLPDGKLPAPDHVFKEYQKYMQAAGKSASGSWSIQGPASYVGNNSGQPTGMGRINAIAFHPTDANIIYIGSPSGGFWKTTNGGTSWTNLSNDLPTIGISSILIHPTNPDIIYIGSGDRDAGDARPMGVFKSTNGGSSWTRLINNMGDGNLVVGAMVMHPTDPNTIIAATSQGIYKTTDGGSNWARKSDVDSYKDIKIKPGAPAVMYAVKTGFVVNSEFYRSTDTGETWTRVTSGFPASTGYRMVIGVSSNNPEYVFLVVLNPTNSTFGGILKSTNSGVDFILQATTPNILGYACDGSDDRSQAPYDLCVAVDPADANKVFVGGINNWKTTNGGQTWAISSHWIGSAFGENCAATVHADQHVYEWNPLNNRLYVGHDGGISYTADGGTTWTEITNNLAITQIYRLGQGAANTNANIIGCQDNGTHATNNGSSFTTIYGGDGMECIVDYSDQNYCYGSLYYGSIFRSTSGPTGSYGAITATGEQGDWVTPYLLHETTPTTMFAGYKNVWRSTNIRAATVAWEAISTGETNTCSVLEQSPANVNILYAVRSGSLKRTDNANDAAASVSWTSCTLPGGSDPRDLEAHPTDQNIVYASAGYKTYKSTDKGASWTDISSNLPSLYINCIVMDKNSNEGLYVGNETSVWYKSATMSDWILFSTGLPPVDIRELEIFYDPVGTANKLKAATYGRGLWQSDLYESGVLNPINFTATASSSNQIDLAWVLNVSSNNVMMAYNTSPTFGTPVNGNTYAASASISGGGTVLYNGSGTSFNHAALSANTTYYYKIWSYNGSTEYSTGATANASTPCGAFSLPFTENFDAETFPPQCWGVFRGANNLGTGFDWVRTITNTYNGSAGAAFVQYENVVDGELAADWLVTPGINIPSAGTATLSFYEKKTYSVYNSNYYVKVSETNQNTGFTNIAAYDETGITTTYTQRTLDLTTYHGKTIYIAFVMTNDDGDNWYVDDVSVINIPPTWNGAISSNWHVAGNWSGNSIPASNDHVMIASTTNKPVIQDNTAVVTNNLTIQSGAILTINAGRTLTVNGTLTNSAGNTGLVIQSNASATGSLIHNSASIGATVNRYISGNAEAWHFISSPVSGQAISGSWTPAGSYTDGSGYDFYAYSEPSNMWLNKKDLANNIASFNVGQGYMIAYQASNPTKTFAGNLNNGSTSIAITRSGTSTYVGSNLVGNPYSSSIDWKADPGWTRTNLVSNGSGYDLYIWNQTVDNYGVYNSASVTDAGTNSASRYIGPMQGFIVAASGSGNLIMDNNVRVHNNAGTWLKNTETESNTIRIKALSENGYGSDEAIVEYGHAGNTGGAEKMFSFVETAPSVYLPKDNTDYSISFLKSVTDTYLVPLNFKAGADGTYRMEFTFDPSAFTMAELEDHSTGMRQNLKESTVYSFSSGTTDAADRFTIHFGAVGINEDEAAGQLRAYVYNNNLYIENEAAKAILQLFDLKGRLIESVSFNETGLICHPLQIPAGLYVVRLQTETSVKTAKVFVK